MQPQYIKVQLAPRKFALARRDTGGVGYTVLASGTEWAINHLLEIVAISRLFQDKITGEKRAAE
jgi:hypothetical protein